MMNAKDALHEAHKLRLKHENEIDKARWVQAEEHRIIYETSIRCGHDKQDYIEIGEFDFALCSDCLLLVMSGLIDAHSRLTDGINDDS